MTKCEEIRLQVPDQFLNTFACIIWIHTWCPKRTFGHGLLAVAVIWKPFLTNNMKYHVTTTKWRTHRALSPIPAHRNVTVKGRGDALSGSGMTFESFYSQETKQ